MSLRTIMIFPEFKNMEIIDNIRNKYDPLAEKVRPHLTLVFPFESKMTDDDLSVILDNRLQTTKPFELKLGGISKQVDNFGNHLFLNVLQGTEELCFINQLLYENEFKEFDKGLHYIPHMTIGKLSTAEELDDAYNDIKSIKHTFNTIVNKISVEMIGENEESIVTVEVELKYEK